MTKEETPATAVPSLAFKSKQVSYWIRPEDLEVIQLLYAELCKVLDRKLSYVEFFRTINPTLLHQLQNKADEKTIVTGISVAPIHHIEENKALRKELEALKKQANQQNSSADTEQLQIELQKARDERDRFRKECELKEIQLQNLAPKANDEWIKLSISLIPEFEAAYMRRFASKLSQSREEFIDQLYKYAKATQPAKHLL